MSKELPESVYWLNFETTGLDPDRDWILECSLYRAPFLNPFAIECVVDTPIQFFGLSESGEISNRQGEPPPP